MSFRGTSSLLALLALSAPALADVTPAEVWQNWIDYYKVNGYTVTEGARDEAGDTLTLTDVGINRDLPDGKLKMTVPRVQLQATGDGKVRTTLDTMTAELDSEDSDGAQLAVQMSAAMPGSEIVSSGSANDMTHDTTAPTITFKIDQIKTGDQTLTDVLSLTATDNAFFQHVVTGDKTTMEYNGSSGQTDLAIKADVKGEDGSDGSVDGTFSIASLKASGQGLLPTGINMDDLPAALRAGLSFNGTAAIGGFTGKFNVTETDDDGTAKPSKVALNSSGVSVTAGLTVDGLNYQVDSDGFGVELETPDMPFPIKYSTDSASAALQIPVSKTETPMPFKLAYSVSGLKLGEEIWAMFDPGKKLPRDPANIDLDVTGMTRLTMDLFDAEKLASHDHDEDGADEPDVAAPDAVDSTDMAEGDDAGDDDTMPFQPTEISLNQLLIDAVGAKLTATGALTIPEGGDISAPVGTISARYEGVNGLIDKLVDMGVMSKEEVTGYRMMLAMFTKAATDGGDVLTTDLDFKDDGSIFANGQQVK